MTFSECILLASLGFHEVYWIKQLVRDWLTSTPFSCTARSSINVKRKTKKHYEKFSERDLEALIFHSFYSYPPQKQTQRPVVMHWGKWVVLSEAAVTRSLVASHTPLLWFTKSPWFVRRRSAAVSVPTVTGFRSGNNYTVNWTGICNIGGDKRSWQELLLHPVLALSPRPNGAYFHTDQCPAP